MESYVKYIGFLAGFFTVVSFIPQVRKAWKSRQVRDLSKGTLILLLTGGVLWLTYGVMSGDWPVIVTNGGMVLLITAVLVAKLKFE